MYCVFFNRIWCFYRYNRIQYPFILLWITFVIMILITLIYPKDTFVESLVSYKTKVILFYISFKDITCNRPHLFIFLGAMFIISLFILCCIFKYLGMLPVRDQNFINYLFSIIPSITLVRLVMLSFRWLKEKSIVIGIVILILV